MKQQNANICSLWFYVYFLVMRAYDPCLGLENAEDTLECTRENEEFGLLQYAPDNCKDRPLFLRFLTDVFGCRCKKGYIQLSYFQKKCIHPSECECPKNEEWRSFDENRKLQRCSEPPKERGYLFQYSPFYMKNRGCTCKKGFLMNRRGNCVTPEECSA